MKRNRQLCSAMWNAQSSIACPPNGTYEVLSTACKKRTMVVALVPEEFMDGTWRAAREDAAVANRAAAEIVVEHAK